MCPWCKRYYRQRHAKKIHIKYQQHLRSKLRIRLIDQTPHPQPDRA